MNMNKNNLFGIGILFAVLLIFTAPAAAENFVYFEPDPSSAAPGETITVTMWVNTINGTAGFQNDLYFDPTVVNITEITPGYYNSYWMVIPYYEQNFIRFGGDSPDFHDHTGVRILANITLEAIGSGTCALDHDDYPVAKLYDEYGGSVPDQVWYDGTFTCVGPAETFTKDLASGWNLVSLPLTPDDNSVSAVLGSISQDAVKSYNAATHQFEDATTMDPGVGYFIHMTAADTWSYDGTAYTSMTTSLSQGLNCVGWTNETGSALPGALDSIDGSYRYVARWNAGTQSYEVCLPGAPAVFNDFATMDRGVGYFIAATAGCTLAYP
jgi:hypothetical protein